MKDSSKSVCVCTTVIPWLAVFGFAGAAMADPNPESIDECQIISESGSYILESDIPTDGEYLDSGDCLEIAADNVTVDLNGFSILGDGPGTRFGVYAADRRNIEIRNGTVRDFGLDGIRAGLNAENHRLINLRASDNAGSGILVDGIGHLVKNSIAANNGFSGIVLGFAIPPLGTGSRVIDSVAADNGAIGIFTRDGSTVSGSSAQNSGSFGIVVGAGSTVTGSTSRNNSSGISGGGEVTLVGNTATLNQGNGINGGFNSTIKNNASHGNGVLGIFAALGSVVTGNSANNNGLDGLRVLSGSTVSGNTARNNGANGINVGGQVTVIGNTVTQNQDSGILSNNSLIDRNTASGNNQSGGAGLDIACFGVCTIGTNHTGP